ncbi:hypothetical protein GE09DRAFT_129779 [Coniochaeta sp. 2T2.1]|nr:hypothetical protein GE09DRAFT_129779 [Coniochaeta sp. 2T2.1]
MATPFDPALPSNSFLFDIYADHGQAPAPASVQPQPRIPSGPCNFADTTPGAAGAKCGCRRFWSRHGGNLGNNIHSDKIGWCMCSHHACYHDDFPSGQGQMPLSTAMDVFAGQENERPRTNREPLSPVQDMSSFQVPTIAASMDMNLLDIPASFQYQNHELAVPQAAVSHGQDSSMPDTLNWATFLNSQPGQDGSFPPIPPQCLMPSRPPSTASSSQARYLRPFAGKGLQTLSGASAAKTREPLLDRITETSVPPEAAVGVPGSNTAHDEHAKSSATMTGPSRDAFQHISKTVQGHEQRLERLENTSFSVAGHEECQEKHDHTDLRVTELESRVDEVEKILNNDGSSIGSGGRRGLMDDATASVASFSTTTAGASEMYSQLQALQAQVSQLQNASAPSYNNPWELEVVFLPFPLKGIWMEARDIQGRTSDEWTQMPATGSRATPGPLSPTTGPAYGDFHGPDWLLPRACAPGGMVDKRLRSRGLMKTIAVRGPDARSVQLAINIAFADVLRVGGSSDMGSRALVHRAAHHVEPPPLGLQQAWVPLRKIHKDSRLRFLAPAELVTPSLWDYAFLTSSVVMRASGMQRLYITQREAYLQDHPLGYQAVEFIWTWQKLRTLTRVYPDSQSSSGEIPEADALEACWTWNDRLDEPPSSTDLRAAQPTRSWGRRSSTSPSQQYFTGQQSPILSHSPAALRAQSPILTLKDRRPNHPSHIRTNSLPATVAITSSPKLPKRRPSRTTNPYSRHPSPLIQRSSPRPLTSHPHPTATATATATTSIKRRSTRSPSVLHPQRTTPRWSQARLSRSPSLAPPFAQVFDDRSAERRTTPFCYATPYSNAPASARATSRPPLTHANQGYYADDGDDEGVEDEDMHDDHSHGSETDPYDSEATNAMSPQEIFARRRYAYNNNNNNNNRGETDDDGDVDVDIDVYEDELGDLDTDVNSSQEEEGGHTNNSRWGRSNTVTRNLVLQDHAHGQVVPGGGGGVAPEDEPWPGIEDDENVDPMAESDGQEDSDGGEEQGAEGQERAYGRDVSMDFEDAGEAAVRWV